ncbi:hypothetical protein B0H10DRAFT_2066207 [Mycena sp. CBHHK59/15]|nr:hypothetical protein B0H10DRAFT_2066207 [Mycena sp. CBHHK59/15]
MGQLLAQISRTTLCGERIYSTPELPSMDFFPQELIDVIVEEVHDSPSLKSCSLVATSFRSPCQRKIYRSLWLYRGSSHRRPSLADGSALIMSSPHLASYVRDLTVELPKSQSGEDAHLECILRSVTNIERLLLAGMSISWKNLSPGLASAILHLISVPSLDRLHLLNMFNIPPNLIAFAVSSVAVLSVFGISLDTQEETQMHASSFTSPADLQPPAPTYFPPYTAHIDRLTLRMDPESNDYDQRLLTACAPTLRFLVIDPGALTDPIELPHLPLVRQVEIKVFVDQKRRLSRRFPSTLSKVASVIPLLEVLILRFIIEPLSPEVPWPEADALPIFDTSFANRMELLHLRKVRCELVPRNSLRPMDTAFEHFVGAMEARTPGLQGTGVFACTLTDPLPTYTDRLP